MSQQSHLTVIGDRQAGKSYLLLTIAIRDAQDGKTVLYSTDSIPMAEVRFDDAIRMCQWDCQRTVRSTREVSFEGGGLIVFRSASQYSGRYARDIHTHLIDDCHAEPRPEAERVVRAVLR